MDIFYDVLDKVVLQLKRLGVLFTIVIGLGIIGWFWWQAGANDVEITNYPPTGSTIVAFGDSLVKGIGASRSGGFVKILEGRLGLPIINEGVSGDTTRTALARISNVTRHNPDIVLVLLGGNDVLKRLTTDDTFSNLRAIVTLLREQGAVVLVLGVQSGVFFDDFAEAVEQLSLQLGTAYVPKVLRVSFDKPPLKDDPIHPNDAGYAVIADHVEPTLRALLQ
mgnify:CR=1 FL=1